MGGRVRAQCTEAATTRPEGSIFWQTRPDHGANICRLWCFSQKLNPRQAAQLAGLDSHVATDLNRNARLAAAQSVMDLEGGELLGGSARKVVVDER